MNRIIRLTAVITALIFTVCILSAPSSALGASGCRKLGDADNDGVVTIIDVTHIQRSLILVSELDGSAVIASDADSDGDITVIDTTWIQRYLAENEIPYPVGEALDLYPSERALAVEALSKRFADAADSAPSGAPVMLLSYDTQKIQLISSAYTYDNALAAMAFLSVGMEDKAKRILDAFVYASEHDRYKAGIIRNAYAAGDISYDDNGRQSVRLPGWYDYSAFQWYEDPTQTGSYVGNTAYAALAMLWYDEVCGGERYLSAAKTLMDRVIAECSDSSPGFTAGFEGWPENGGEEKLEYKSTEHNIDAYTVFSRLYSVTGDEKYRSAAESALTFVMSMYSEDIGAFYTGTRADGSINTDMTALDAQVWAALALGDGFAPYERALDLTSGMKVSGGGYPFCKENKNGGWWAEGTAFTALMYFTRGDLIGYTGAMDALNGIRQQDGLFPSATVDNLYTGIILKGNIPWEYNKDPHIAPTAWFVMASNGFDPYSFG